MARIELDIDTDVPRDAILASLIDFSERRPDLWPGLNRNEYRVIAVGDTWADVREGNGGQKPRLAKNPDVARTAAMPRPIIATGQPILSSP